MSKGTGSKSTGTNKTGDQTFDAYDMADWWDPAGRQASLLRINPLRFGYFREKAGDNLKDKKVLDVGCGGGILSESFAREGALVTGIDLSPVAIEVAKEHAEREGLKIDYRKVAVSELLKEEGGSYDVVVCSEVLEHVEDLEELVWHCSEMLRPGGVFFFSTINRTLKARLLAVFVAEDLLGMIEPGTHDYERFVKPSRLAALMRERGVVIKDIKGMSYDIFSLDFKISGDTSVNYLGFGLKTS